METVGEGQWPIVCVCVFLCAHMGGAHNVSLVCLTHGGSQGSSPPEVPSTGGRPSLPNSVANHSQSRMQPLSSSGSSP